MMERVSIVRCPNYDEKEVDHSVRKSIELLGGLGGVIKKGSRVLLKPNILTARKPEDGVTTHPNVVKAVAKVVAGAGGIVVIGDCSGSVFYHSTEKSMEESGIKKVAEELNVGIKPFELDGFRKVKVTNGLILKEAYIAKTALDADVIIDLPKLKTHMDTMLTGAVKNMFGCIPNGERKKIHCLKQGDFNKALIDIYSIAKPSLAVMDAVVAMEGNGPSHGPLKEVGVIMASKNPVALDVVATQVMGFKVEDVGTNTAAVEKKLIDGRGGIEVVGETIESVRTKFRRPSTFLQKKPVVRLLSSLTEVKPLVLSNKCAACGVCVKSCPAEAIKIENNRAVIDERKCIKCYCCHELCPKDAVTLKESLILKTMKKLGAK